MKAHTDKWVAMEDEDDEGEEEDGEEVMKVLFGRKKMRRLTLSQIERKLKCLSYSIQPYMYACIPKANIVSFE